MAGACASWTGSIAWRKQRSTTNAACGCALSHGRPFRASNGRRARSVRAGPTDGGCARTGADGEGERPRRHTLSGAWLAPSASSPLHSSRIVLAPPRTATDGLRRDELLATLNRHRSYLRHFMARSAGALEAEDLVQEVFLLACRKIGTFRGAASIRSWLRQIARNRVRNEMKARSCRQAREAEFVRLSEPSSRCPFEAAAADETRQRLRATFTAMPRVLRQTLQARVVGGVTLAVLAREHAVSVGTVHRWEQLARARLTEALDGDG